MTGITRVGKESIFSDLNNLEVVTTTSKKYETALIAKGIPAERIHKDGFALEGKKVLIG